MRILTEKLCSKRGETIAEMLVSIAVLSLAVSLTAAMIMTSYNITRQARLEEEKYNHEMSNAEKMIGIISNGEEVTATVIISPKEAIDTSETVSITVTLNGTTTDGNALRSYSLQKP